jgi:hypothetical protein
MELMAHLVQQGLRVYKGQSGQWECLAQTVLRELPGLQERKGLKVSRVTRVLRAFKGLRDHKDLQELPEQLAQQEHKVLRV